jgi:predicted nucleotidyltransferase
MTPEQLVKRLQEALSGSIRSIVLYGSAAAGDYTGPRSDYNILVVADRLGARELSALSAPSMAWKKAGNPLPLFFTLDRLERSADVFPIELMDIRDSHRVLYGENVIERVTIRPENLRLILEHQLKAALIQLREGMLETGGKPSRVVDLMIDSLSTVLVLARASLRLHQDAVPMLKMDALRELNAHIRFDAGVFRTIEDLKERRRQPGEIDALETFDAYIRNVEMIVDAVDAFIHQDE